LGFIELQFIGGIKMADEKVKLPRSSYEELCKVIKAYGRLDKPSSLDQVKALAGVGKTVISANNSFLSSTGIIEGGRAKIVTDLGKNLAKALEHDIPNKIQSAWKQVVEKDEFLNKMALALKIRKTMEESSFISHIAYSAGETKSGFVMTGARTVIDILRASGLISEKDGKLTSSEALPESASKFDEGEKVFNGKSPQKTVTTAIPHNHILKAGNKVSFHIELRIEAKPDELDDLGPKLKNFLKVLSEEKIDDNNDS
jgi:hypothetical protein